VGLLRRYGEAAVCAKVRESHERPGGCDPRDAVGPAACAAAHAAYAGRRDNLAPPAQFDGAAA